MLQALASAEAAYSHALARVSDIDMRGEADGASLSAALRAFSSLPAAVGAQHDHVRALRRIVFPPFDSLERSPDPGPDTDSSPYPTNPACVMSIE